MVSRIRQGIASLRELFHRLQRPAASVAVLEAPPQRISVQAAVPAHRVAAVTEELNMRVQRILQRVADEERGLATTAMAPASTLLVLGLRVEGPSEERPLLH